MIEYVSGALVELTPTYAVIDCNGLGYIMNISLSTYVPLESDWAKARCESTGGKLPDLKVKLLAHEIIREDAHTLYGFLTQRERMMFQALIGVSGVGANTARMLLSSIQPSELEGVIMGGDAKRLKSVKGVGSKTAERIIVDLKDKIKPQEDTQLALAQDTQSVNDVFDEALSALVMLGFPRPQSQKVLRKIFESNPAVKVEAAIKLALTMM